MERNESWTGGARAAAAALTLAALAVIAAGALAGCATAPPAPPDLSELEVPPAWTATPAATPMDATPVDATPVEATPVEATPVEAPPDRWWHTFGSAELDRLVDEALAESYDLRAAAAAVDAAAAQARIAGADLWPRLNGGVTARRQQQVFVGLPIPGQDGPLTSLSTTYGASLDVSWEPDLWGRIRAGAGAAQSALQAARADERGARLSLAGQTAKAWLTMVEARRQLELAQATLDSRTTTTERLDARYRRGVAAPLDLRLARTTEAQTRSDVELRRRQLDAAARQLDLLLGSYPAARLAAGTAVLPPVPPPVPAGVPAEVVTRRPDLAAAELRLAAAGYRVSEARAALYPRLTLTGSGGTASDAVGDLLDGDFTVWSLAGSLLQPIFQGGRLRAAVELAEADRARVLATYAADVLAAFAEVETALAAERWLAAEEEALRVAAEESSAAARLAEDRYLAGVGDYLPVLDSQRQAFATESRLLAVRALRLRNRVDLHLALGGGFGLDDTTGPQPAAPQSTAVSEHGAER